MHSFWSRLDKNYIIPFISFPRRGPSDELSTPHESPNPAGRGSEAGMELEVRDSSLEIDSSDLDLEAKGRLSYDGFDQNPNNLDTSLFDEDDARRQLDSQRGDENYDHDFQPRAASSEDLTILSTTNKKWNMDATGHGVLLRKAAEQSSSPPPKSATSLRSSADSD